MEKIKVIVKDELFKKVGLSVEKCSAYTEDTDRYVRVNGVVTCDGEWDEQYCLIIMANLCNEEDEIVHIDHDFDEKTFLKVGYESFSVSCFKCDNQNIKYVELYPKIIKAKERK